jgi:hypothetical protein
MSDASSPPDEVFLTPTPTSETGDEKSAALTFFDKLDIRFDGLSDLLNPILVKETRQALKSRQFLTTFFSLLLCAWAWSLLSITLQLGSSQFGQQTLAGFFVVLAVPMIVIVPYSAFRSLAREREDGTHELLSITTLGARQIVMGKLGSATVQMVLFYSVLAPCIAFTYLLRGVDILLIGVLLWYTFLLSLLLSSFGLLLAAAARANHWQVLLSLLLLGGLVITLFFSWGIGTALIYQSSLTSAEHIWAINLAMNMFAFGLLVLFMQGAGAQISFVSDNRSTRPRITMVILSCMIVGWSAVGFFLNPQIEVGLLTASIAGIFWAILGALLTGEIGQLSPRVRRSLPQTGLGRILLTWFNPGGGTGYFFTLCNLAAMLTVINITALLSGVQDTTMLQVFSALVLVYVAAYLGTTRLLVGSTSRWTQPGPLGALVITITLCVFGCILPWTCQMLLWRVFGETYSAAQTTNWIWTLTELVDRNSSPRVGLPLAVMVVLAAVIAIANLFMAGREVGQHRTASPRRISEDDNALHPKQEASVEKIHPLDASG